MKNTSRPIFQGLIRRSLTLLLLLASQMPAQASGQEELILSKWKQSATSSSLGLALLAILNECNRSLALNSLNYEANFKRGYLYGIIGCTDYALADLSKAITINPGDSRALTERGLCYMDCKQYDRAISDLNSAIQLKPQNGNALLARGRLWLLKGKPMMAIADLRACLSNDTKFTIELPGEYPANQYNAPAYYLGQCYESLGRPGDAAIYYKEALQAKSSSSSSGYLHRYADQPVDTKYRVARLEQ